VKIIFMPIAGGRTRFDYPIPGFHWPDVIWFEQLLKSLTESHFFSLIFLLTSDYISLLTFYLKRIPSIRLSHASDKSPMLIFFK